MHRHAGEHAIKKTLVFNIVGSALSAEKQKAAFICRSSTMCAKSRKEKASLCIRPDPHNRSPEWDTPAHKNRALTSQQVWGWRTSKSKYHQQMCSVHWPGFEPAGLLTWSRNGCGIKDREHMQYSSGINVLKVHRELNNYREVLKKG